MRAIKSLDLFPKTGPQVEAKDTAAGGCISLTILSLMLFLFLTELNSYLFSSPLRQASIEPFEEDRRMRIDLNISLFKVPCEALAMDYEDTMGSHYFAYTLKVLRLDYQGQILNMHQAEDFRIEENAKTEKTDCGSCYGAELHEEQCCNTCDEVIDAYARKGWNPPDKRLVEQCRRKLFGGVYVSGGGCQIFGHLTVKEVPGAVHISLNPLGQMIFATGGEIDFSHSLNHLQARDPDSLDTAPESPATTPLDHTTAYGHTHYLYYLKLTSARDTDGKRFWEAAGHYKGHLSNAIPTLYIQYEIDPITMKYNYTTSFCGFLISLFAILGGSFACSTFFAKIILT